MHKVGIIIPYRDRPKQLLNSKKELVAYLVENKVNYELIIVEQFDPFESVTGRREFNRGKLLNVGFKKAKELGCDYVCFHDLDMLPVKVDYSYADRPTQLANRFIYQEGVDRTVSDEYFGGVTLFPTEQFELINGYSNNYWGWGFEDNDLLLRSREKGLPLDTKYYRQSGKDGVGIEFDGKKSFVRIPNLANFRKPFSIYCTFKVYGVESTPKEISDEAAVYGIPGRDFNLSYNSFNTYKFETFNTHDEVLSIHSENLPPLTCKSIVVIDPRTQEIDFYLNNKKIGKKQSSHILFPYKDEKYMYLGVANPMRDERQKYFKGYITEFALYDKKLSKEEIKALNNNTRFGLTQKFPDYNAGVDLKVYYDGSNTVENVLKDLSGNGNDGQMFNCGLVPTYQPQEYLNLVPTRRYSTFNVMKHKENGYKDGYWRQWASRENQLRYFDIVKNGTNSSSDGLTTCKYRVRTDTSYGNYHYLAVDI